MILNEMTQNRTAKLGAQRTVHRTSTTECGLPSALSLSVEKPKPVFKNLCQHWGKFSPSDFHFSQLFPQQRQCFCAPGNLFLDGTSAAVQSRNSLVREDADPASSILRTSAAAQCFPIAINHTNSEFGICVSFCWSLYRKKKSFLA